MQDIVQPLRHRHFVAGDYTQWTKCFYFCLGKAWISEIFLLPNVNPHPPLVGPALPEYEWR
jgi:hypothetical protein